MPKIHNFSHIDYSRLGINVDKNSSGQIQTICPQCSSSRKKKDAKCLSVNLDDGLWLCHHCGWNGSLNSSQTTQESDNLTDKAIAFLTNRKISIDAIRKMKITGNSEWMPGNRSIPTIKFPYLKDGHILNTKYRGLQNKCFRLTKGAELILYNIDCLKEATEVHIVEGEIDALTLLTAGISNVVSVPNGANAKSNNLKFINLDDFQDIKTIYITTDDDEPGNKLAQDLAKLFSHLKCKRVKFGGHKDANELYCKTGSLDGFVYTPINVPNSNHTSAPNFDFTGSDSTLNHRKSARITRNYKRKNTKPALTLCGKTLIGYGEIFTLVGHPGSFKSSLMEIIIVAFLQSREYCRFATNPKGGKVLLIDTERPPDDVYKSHCNILKRLGENELSKGSEQDSLVHLALSECGSVEELKSILQQEISTGEFELVLLDGILDFCLSMNDDRVANELVKWVRGLAVKYNCGIIASIHPNKSSDVLAGHLGSFLSRYSRAILYLREVVGNNAIKELTSNGSMAKLSHDDISSLDPVYFMWNEQLKLVMECDYEPQKQRGKEEKIQKAFESALSGGKKLRYKEFVNALVNDLYKESTVKRWIKYGTESGMIIKSYGYYSLKMNNP